MKHCLLHVCVLAVVHFGAMRAENEMHIVFSLPSIISVEEANESNIKAAKRKRREIVWRLKNGARIILNSIYNLVYARERTSNGFN